MIITRIHRLKRI